MVRSFIRFVFIVCPNRGLSKYIETRVQISLAFSSYKAFSKNKEVWNWSFALFSAWFLKKNISRIMMYSLTKFHCLITFFSWDIGQYVSGNFVFLVVSSRILKITIAFSSSHFTVWPKGLGHKLKYFKNEKSF